MKWTQEQLAEISTLQEKHTLTRKSAVQRFRRQLKAQGKAAPAPAAPVSVLQEPGTPDNSAPEAQTRAAVAAKAKKATTPGRKRDDAAQDVPLPPLDNVIELRPVAESLAHMATIRGRRAVVCFYQRNREKAANRFYSVTIREAVLADARKLAKAESLPLYIGVEVRVAGKLDQGWLLTEGIFKAHKRGVTDMMLTPIARAAYAVDPASKCGVRFEIAKETK